MVGIISGIEGTLAIIFGALLLLFADHLREAEENQGPIMVLAFFGLILLFMGVWWLV